MLANDGKKKTAATSALCKPLHSFPCPASSCWKVPDEVICTSNQYAAGHFTVTNLRKSDLRQTQNSLKGLFMDEGLPSEIWLRQRTPVLCLLVCYYKNLKLGTCKKMEVKKCYNSASSKRRHKSRHIKSRADYSPGFLCCNWIVVAFDCRPHKTRHLKMSIWDFENGPIIVLRHL